LSIAFIKLFKVTSKKPIAAPHKVHKMEIVQDKHTNQLHSKIKNGIEKMNEQAKKFIEPGRRTVTDTDEEKRISGADRTNGQQ
jgi:hypothetical protein